MKKDPRRPVFHVLRRSAEGDELVIALYTRGCIYGACSFCSLPALSAGDLDIGAPDIDAQVDFSLDQYEPEQLAGLSRVSIYNSGSILDQRTVPTSSLWHLFERISALPAVAVVSLDTRAEFVESWELDGIKDRLGKARLELSVGYETQDAGIRNGVLRKGLSEGAFQRLCALLAQKAVQLKAYVMIKPDAAMSEEDGVREAVRTLEHLAETGASHGLKISAHLNPTYVAEGSALEKEFHKRAYVPPRLWSAVDILLALKGRRLAIQVGLDTEGLAVEGGTFRNCGQCDASVREALRVFSGTQDFAPLKSLSCSCR